MACTASPRSLEFDKKRLRGVGTRFGYQYRRSVAAIYFQSSQSMSDTKKNNKIERAKEILAILDRIDNKGKHKAKHKELKATAKVITSRCNPSYTLAIKQQLLLNYRFISRKGFCQL